MYVRRGKSLCRFFRIRKRAFKFRNYVLFTIPDTDSQGPAVKTEEKLPEQEQPGKKG